MAVEDEPFGPQGGVSPGQLAAEGMSASRIAGLDSGTPDDNDVFPFVAVVDEVAPTHSSTVGGAGHATSVIAIGGKSYTVVASGATGDQINAGSNAATFLANILAKVNADTATTLCTATNPSGNDLLLTGNAGVGATPITLTSNDASFPVTAFSGGVDYSETLQKAASSVMPQPLMSFVDHGNSDLTIDATNWRDYHGKTVSMPSTRTVTVTDGVPSGFWSTIQDVTANTHEIIAGGTLTLQNVDGHNAIKASGHVTVWRDDGDILHLVGETDTV